MQENVLDCLRRIIYHRLEMWDAAREAEILFSDEVMEVDTSSDELDYFASCLGESEEALKLSEEDLKTAFPNLWQRPSDAD